MSHSDLDIQDHTDLRALHEEVLAGLRRSPKRTPPKYFYDQRGSELFEAICAQPEYYVTETELEILGDQGAEIAAELGDGVVLLEYGTGSSHKVSALLSALQGAEAYVPIDISESALVGAAQTVRTRFPDLEVIPIVGDFTQPHLLVEAAKGVEGRRVAWIPGSTIGNLDRAQAVDQLKGSHALVGEGGGLLIGVDRKKDVSVLESAYNDAAGVTADFNKNVLHRLNEELDAGFDLDAFEHRAIWNDDLGRIEMHLESKRDQTVEISGESFHFAAGETIHTESSHKYSPEEFIALAAECGFHTPKMWTDPAGHFAVFYFRA